MGVAEAKARADAALADFGDYTKIPGADPLRLAARVLVALSGQQQVLVANETKGVQAFTNHLKGLNTITTLLNEALTELKGKGDGDTNFVSHGAGTDEASKKAMQDLKTAWEAEGIPGTYITVAQDPTSTPPNKWGIRMVHKEINDSVTRIQSAVDEIGSLSQQGQVKLQTLVGRYNNVIEEILSLLRKFETLFGTVSGNARG